MFIQHGQVGVYGHVAFGERHWESRQGSVRGGRTEESATDVRSFLGLANYSSRFITHFATLSEPLRED